MENTTNQIKDLKTQIEEAKEQIKLREEELTRTEEALKEAEFLEILKKIEDKLIPLYQKEMEEENQISSTMNKLFKRTVRAVEKTNMMYKDLSVLKKEIKNAESQITQNAQHDGSAVRDAIELKRAQVAQDFKVVKQIKGASYLVKHVNMAISSPAGVYQGLFEEDFGRLPSYAQNIYDAVKKACPKSFRARMDDLIRISRIPEPRIIIAREMVVKFLDKLKENNLIEYSFSGDTFTVRDSKA
ncbi:MAG: hypothetical protein KAX20_00455 [Candidatus Omnitrophica bacterium]|nr:hypothetical protein [Candidatus Omnitrophota bacterium]